MRSLREDGWMKVRDGLTTAHGFMRRDGKPDTHNAACMKDCVQTLRLSSQIPDYARDSHGNLALQTRPLGAVEGVDTSQPAAIAKAEPTPRGSAPAELAKALACMTCHGVTNKVVGPAFRDVAQKYANDKAAETRLATKLREGGAGAWGAVPMPAQPQVKEADARALVQWILAGAK